MARGAGRTARTVLITLLGLAVLGGLAAGLWALRPTPVYSSDGVTTGSPFDVTFRIENESPWFPLANLRVYCVLASVRALPLGPAIVEAGDLALRGTIAGGLAPGEQGSFTCPLRRVVDVPPADDSAIAQRAEIYFRSQYDVPYLGSLRLTDNSRHYVLNTQLLPPRWTRKPAQ